MTQETLLSEDNNEEVSLKWEDAVGEGKRWKDQETLLKAKLDSDSYIKTLEKRLDDSRDMYNKVREENMAQAKLQELIDQLERKQLTSNEDTHNVNEGKPAIRPEEIEGIFDKRFNDQIQRYEQDKRQRSNLNTVKAELTKRYGDNYQTAVREQLSELGITSEDLDNMAKRSPALVMRTLGLDRQKEKDIQMPRSSGAFKPKVEQKHKPMSYYQDLKKTNPRAYLDPKISIQMDRDSQALGESFFDVPE